ncbi:MAG: hypothetical protein IPG85_09080 [Bacteroidetes bacterium]|nr:hypothetical protein [Bacteroidota bacterium]
MEIITTVVSLLLFVGLILSPIIILRLVYKSNIKLKFISYLTIGLIVTAIIVLAFAWWTYKSDIMLLKYYGYNIDAKNETEFYGKVLPENMDRVKSLKTSIMGIGWPLKAFMTFVFYTPFLLIVYFFSYLIGKNRAKNLNIQTEQ